MTWLLDSICQTSAEGWTCQHCLGPRFLSMTARFHPCSCNAVRYQHLGSFDWERKDRHQNALGASDEHGAIDPIWSRWMSSSTLRCACEGARSQGWFLAKSPSYAEHSNFKSSSEGWTLQFWLLICSHSAWFYSYFLKASYWMDLDASIFIC